MQERKGTWLMLLTYCLAAVLVVSLAFATIFAGASLAFGQSFDSPSSTNTRAEIKTFSGVITDSHCGAKHSADSGKNSAECARACLRGGAKYVLVNGDKTYVLSGNQNELDRLVGERTQVQGTLEGNIVKVISTTAR